MSEPTLLVTVAVDGNGDDDGGGGGDSFPVGGGGDSGNCTALRTDSVVGGGGMMTLNNGCESNNLGNGNGLTVGGGGGDGNIDDQLLQQDVGTTVTVLHIPKRVKRMGKVDFVRFDSKEMVYADENHDELVRNKIKEEIQR